MNKIGDKIKGYELTKELSTIGGQGVLYEAKNEIGKEVAIKFLRTEYLRNEYVRQTFKKEAQLMVNLDHENIVNVIDYNEDDQSAAIIMELLKGNDLEAILKKEKTISVEKALDWFRQILGAFQFAHEKGVVHRDVKPSNIFITTSGRIKILDFGIAKLMDPSLIADGASVPTSFASYSERYRSPEQIKKPKEIDQRSDIFNLGLVLYIMLTGKHPFNDDGDILEEPIPYNSLIPVSLFEVIQKATTKDRDYRILNAKEFWTALEGSQDSDKTFTGKTIVDYSNPTPQPPPPTPTAPPSTYQVPPPLPQVPNAPPQPIQVVVYNQQQAPPEKPQVLPDKLPMSSFIYSPTNIKVAAFFGGIFCTGLFMSRNFKRFGDESNATIFLWGGILVQLFLLFVIGNDFYPEGMSWSQTYFISNLINVGITHFLVESYQKDKINDYIKRGGIYESNWKVLGITLVYVVLVILPIGCTKAVTGVLSSCSN